MNAGVGRAPGSRVAQSGSMTDVAFGALAALIGAAGVLWVGAAAAAVVTGHEAPATGLAGALALVREPSDPSAAWGTPMPGPVGYWAVTGVVVAAAAAVVILLVRWSAGMRDVVVPTRATSRHRDQGRSAGSRRAADRHPARPPCPSVAAASPPTGGRIPARPVARRAGMGVGGGLDPRRRAAAVGKGPARGHPDALRRPGCRRHDVDPAGQPRRHLCGAARDGAGRSLRSAGPRRWRARRTAVVAGARVRRPADRDDPRARAGRRDRDLAGHRRRRLLAGADRDCPARALHAAAIDGRAARDLYRWSLDPAAVAEAITILGRPSAAPGWDNALSKAGRELRPRTRDSIWLGVRQARPHWLTRGCSTRSHRGGRGVRPRGVPARPRDAVRARHRLRGRRRGADRGSARRGHGGDGPTDRGGVARCAARPTAAARAGRDREPRATAVTARIDVRGRRLGSPRSRCSVPVPGPRQVGGSRRAPSGTPPSPRSSSAAARTPEI